MFLIVAFSLNCDVSSLNSPINDGLSILILYIYWKYKIYLANKWSIEAIELFTDYRKQIDHWNCLLKAITFISLDLPIVWSPTSLSLHPATRLKGKYLKCFFLELFLFLSTSFSQPGRRLPRFSSPGLWWEERTGRRGLRREGRWGLPLWPSAGWPAAGDWVSSVTVSTTIISRPAVTRQS